MSIFSWIFAAQRPESRKIFPWEGARIPEVRKMLGKKEKGRARGGFETRPWAGFIDPET